jgi:hypothetical protein
MSCGKHRHQNLVTKLNFANGFLPSLRPLEIIAAILLVSAIVGCTSASLPTQVIEPTSMGNCFPASVFTAEDMRARVDCHPDEYKMEISEDTVVLFAFPHPIMDWVGPVFIVHVPSVSEVVLKTDGSVLFEGYKNPAGRKAIEGVLNNQELLDGILERAEQIEKRSEP